MRIVVVGIGAVGGLVAARLAQAGFDVLAVARGEHARVVRERGLTVHGPRRTDVVELDVVEVDVDDDLALREPDVVVLATKSHQTAAALEWICRRWSRPLPIVCMQNGIANERAALRVTPTVIAVNVLMPATHLEPGHVHAHWAPVSGVLDLGLFPSGGGHPTKSMTLVDNLCASLEQATFGSQHLAQIMDWKHAKLLMNLGNAVEAVCGPAARGGPLSTRLIDEGGAVLAAAAVTVVELGELAARVQAAGDIGTAGDGGGGSTWQSIQRGAVDLETDYLNGEIVLIARLHRVPAPANDLMRELAVAWARLPERPQPLPERLVIDAIDESPGDSSGFVAQLIEPWRESTS